MKIVRPYARIMSIGNDKVTSDGIEFAGHKEVIGVTALKKIEFCARISHRSEESMDGDSYKRVIKHVVMDHGDWSVVEHSSVTVDALVDRGITHEWVRHRLFSYTQESTRFVNYQKKMPPSFIYPNPDVECELCLSGDEPKYFGGAWHHYNADNSPNKPCVYDHYWLNAISSAEFNYCYLIKDGWRPQEARSAFPNALASRILTTGNLRNWRHFFIMRTTQETHPQMKQVTIPLLAEFKSMFPLLFDDIEPNCKQSESMKRIR